MCFKGGFAQSTIDPRFKMYAETDHRPFWCLVGPLGLVYLRADSTHINALATWWLSCTVVTAKAMY